MANRGTGPGRQTRGTNRHERHPGIGVFDLDDGVGPVGDHGPRHDPSGLAGPDGAGGHIAGGQVGDDRQPQGASVTVPSGVCRGGEVRRLHGIPVHGGVVEAGEVDERVEVGGGDHADRGGQRHPLGGQRVGGGEHPREVLRDRAVSHGAPGQARARR